MPNQIQSDKLTPEQLKNWRNVLAQTSIGELAYFLPDERIQQMRDEMQAIINTKFKK